MIRENLPCVSFSRRPQRNVGFYEDTNFGFHGFLRDPKGNITPFDPPDASNTHTTKPMVENVPAALRTQIRQHGTRNVE
jgi:hypothetical protein